MTSQYTREWKILKCVSNPELVGQSLVGEFLGQLRFPGETGVGYLDNRAFYIWFPSLARSVVVSEANLQLEETFNCYDQFNRQILPGDVLFAAGSRMLVLKIAPCWMRRRQFPEFTFRSSGHGTWCQQFSVIARNVETGQMTRIRPYQASVLILQRGLQLMIPPVPPERWAEYLSYQKKKDK